MFFCLRGYVCVFYSLWALEGLILSAQGSILEIFDAHFGLQGVTFEPLEVTF